MEIRHVDELRHNPPAKRMSRHRRIHWPLACVTGSFVGTEHKL